MMYSFDLTIDSRCAKIPWSKGPRKLCAFIYVLQCTVQLLSYLVDECIGFKFWCEQNMPHMARAISFIKNTFVCLMWGTGNKSILPTKNYDYSFIYYSVVQCSCWLACLVGECRFQSIELKAWIEECT